MDVLVTGATGFVGRHAAVALARAGHHVRCLVRPATDAGDLADLGFDLARGDVLDSRSLEAAVAGVDAVVHSAGLPSSRSHTWMRRVNVEGVARIAAACAGAASPPRRFVLVSSLAASGPSRTGRPVRETDPERPISRYGRSKLAGEFAARRSLPSRTELAIVRPPPVFGPHDRGLLPFFAAAAHGLSARIAGPPRRISLVHGEDLADAIRLAAEHPAAAGRTYYVADPTSLALDELLARIAAVLRRRTRTFVVSDALVRLAGVLVEETARVRGAVPRFTRDRATELLAPGWECDVTRIRAELGWAPAATLDERIAGTVAWYVEHGRLR